MDLCENYKIDSYRFFKEILFYIIEKVEKNEIVQIFMNKPDIYYDEIDILSLKNSKTYPDVIGCFFINRKNLKTYYFSVELYHGRGGYWREISEDDFKNY